MAAQFGCETIPAFKKNSNTSTYFQKQISAKQNSWQALKVLNVKIVLILNRADDSAIFKEMFWPKHLDGYHFLCNHIHARPLNVI